MTKPWEETWEVEPLKDDDRDAVDGIHRSGQPWDSVVKTDSGVYPPTKAEARLIAQAPAMARLLLSLLNDPDWSNTGTSNVRAVLRAAGVVE